MIRAFREIVTNIFGVALKNLEIALPGFRFTSMRGLPTVCQITDVEWNIIRIADNNFVMQCHELKCILSKCFSKPEMLVMFTNFSQEFYSNIYFTNN